MLLREDVATEVCHVPERMMAAWNAGDADAWAAAFTDDASFVRPGVYLQGREQIRASMVEGFAGPYRGTDLVIEIVNVRCITDDVVTMVTEGGVRSGGQLNPLLRATWTLVRQKGRWLLCAYQNAAADST